MNELLDQTQKLLELLGHDEEPIGLYYTDEKPDGPGPKEAPPLSAEAEKRGELDFKAIFGTFSCLMGRILNARKKKTSTWLAADAYGCAGASFYGGFNKPVLEMVVHYISTGIPGHLEGELFMPSPEKSREFFAKIDPVPAPKKYCAFKPLSLFTDGEEPLIVIFFARGELLSGLCSLVTFTTGEPDTIIAPFGAGCTNISAWPLRFLADGMEKAVIGGTDIACRSLYKMDELSLAVSLDLYRKMLKAVPDSFLKTEAWLKVKKRVQKSNENWEK